MATRARSKKTPKPFLLTPSARPLPHEGAVSIRCDHQRIYAPARQVLNSLNRNEGCPWSFLASTNRKKIKGSLANGVMEAAWQKLRSAAGLEDVRLHDLHHTVGTYAGQSGANAFLVRACFDMPTWR